LSVCDSCVDRMWRQSAPSSVLSVYYDTISIKFASHHLLLYVVYMYQKSLNFTYAFKCYQQNVSGFTLAGPPCTHRLWTTMRRTNVSHWYSPIIAVLCPAFVCLLAG